MPNAANKLQIAGIIVLVDVQGVSPTPRLRVQIVGRREGPPLIREQETVVAKVVVGVVDADIEDDSTPELFEIFVHIRPIALDQINQIEVTNPCLGTVAILITE